MQVELREVYSRTRQAHDLAVGLRDVLRGFGKNRRHGVPNCIEACRRFFCMPIQHALVDLEPRRERSTLLN